MFITHIGNGLEAGVAPIIVSTSTVISAALIPVVNIALSIWVMLFAYAVMRGEVQEPITKLSWEAVKKALILNIALATGVYQAEIVPFINGTAADLVNLVAVGAGGTCGLSDVYASMDCVFGNSLAHIGGFFLAAYKSLMSFSLDPWNLGPLNAISDATGLFVAGILVTIGWMILILLIFIEFIGGRIMLMIVMALGPLFIACLAFEPTKKYFDGWLGKVVFSILLQMLVALLLGISVPLLMGVVKNALSLGHVTVTTPADVALAIVAPDFSVVTAVLELLVVMCVVGFLFTRLPSIAGAIAGHQGASSGLGFAMGMTAARMMGGGFKGIPKSPTPPGGKIENAT